MYLIMLKSDDEILSVANGTITTTKDLWVIPEISEPPERRIPREELETAKTKDELENLTPYTRFYLQDSEDKDIVYKFIITVSIHWVMVSMNVYDKGIYLCGKIVGNDFFTVFNFRQQKKDLKLMIDISRKCP